MTEGVVALLLSTRLLNRQLKLALNFSHEKVVDHDVVGRLVKFVLDSDQLELALHALAVFMVQSIHRFQKIDEATLTALILRSQQVADVKSNQI